MSLRIIFMGTAQLACASLAALLELREFEVVAVVTQPDRPKGRDLQLQPSPVKTLALEHKLSVLQPERARDPEFVENLRGLKPDLIIVAAYGQILPPAILDIPPFGCLNVHTSLLPRYRGAAPIQWAILDDEAETGVTIMKMATGLDTGDILSQRATPISPSDNAQTLHDRLAAIGAQLLIQTIFDYTIGKIIPQKQSEADATYARKIIKEDGRLDWSLPARTLWNRVRALTPWPGPFTFQKTESKPRLLKIWQAEVVENVSGQPGELLQANKSGLVVACGTGALRLLNLQREGGRRMATAEFLAGNPLKTGELLG
jgi:methionyl-tRNA formyltransferase